MKKTLISSKELFVCGSIGSGKDTTVKSLQSNGYHKLRTAGTIKNFICDVLGVGYEQLETLKREIPEIREMHHDVASIMDQYIEPIHGNFLASNNEMASLNRLEMILKRQSMDFENPIDKFVISDIRSYVEIGKTLSTSETVQGIFLLRDSDDGEYINNEHWTNQLNFNDENLIDLLNHHHERCIVIDNCGVDKKDVNLKFKNEFLGDINTIPLNSNEIDGKVLTNYINDFFKVAQ